MAPQTRRKTLQKNLLIGTADTGAQKQQQKKKKSKHTKRKKNNSIKEVNISNEELISVTPISIKNNQKNETENTSAKNLNEMKGKDIMNEDFIAFSTGLSRFENKFDEKSFRKKDTVERISEPGSPVTITVEDDDCYSDDSICISETEDSNNDSIQIIKELVKSYNAEMRQQTAMSNPKKRKFDDSIEICLEKCSTPINTAKKGKYDSNVNAQHSCTTSSPNVTLEIIEGQNGQQSEEDDDIIVVETVKKNVSNAIVVEDTVGNRHSQINERRKFHRKSIIRRIRKPSGDRCLMKSFVTQDKVGNAQVRHYKSPLQSIANENSDTSYHNKYGNNMYNPNGVQKSGLRPVVIDGSNIAYGHGGNTFSVRGIDICVNYFAKRGHWVVTFVPLFRRHEASEADRRILDNLRKNRHLVFTPSRYLHGRRVASYDDRFIVQCAAELGGIVVSTDNFRDLVVENEAWRETIEKRLLMFTWVGDILMFPDDPNGRGGPRLEEFLRFPQ